MLFTRECDNDNGYGQEHLSHQEEKVGSFGAEGCELILDLLYVDHYNNSS